MLYRISGFIPFYSWRIFHCMARSHHLYPFLCWWTFGLFPPFVCCEYCCYEHSCSSVESLFANAFIWNAFKSGIIWSCSNSVFNLVRNCQNQLPVFPKRHTFLSRLFRKCVQKEEKVSITHRLGLSLANFSECFPPGFFRMVSWSILVHFLQNFIY